MTKLILTYISEEKDIARYKLSLLEKGARKQYKDRLISVEKDFLNYPFEKLALSSIDDYREAMASFRSDRSFFYAKYERQPQLRGRVVTKSQTEDLARKIKFFEEKSRKIVDFNIKEINLIESSYMQREAGIERQDLSSHGIDYILGLEGASLSKHRARIQVLMHCLFYYMEEKVARMKTASSGETSLDEYDLVRRNMGLFFKDLEHSIFKYYNDAIVSTPLLINGTLGHNSFLSTIYPLSNLLDKYSDRVYLERLLPKDKSFFLPSGRPVKKKFVERGFGILTPMKRMGNESLNLLHLDVWSESGVCMTELFVSQFFNSNLDGQYKKAVATHPIWEWGKAVKNPFLKRELAELLGLEGPLSSEMDLNSEETLTEINSSSGSKILIDSKLTKVMIASTRSESDHIKRAFGYILAFTDSIQDEFDRAFAFNP